MLEALGLTTGQEAVYLALLDTSPVTAGQLAEITGTAVAPELDSLQHKGLVLRQSGQPVHYTAAPPEVAVELLIRSREEDLLRVRADALRLAERFRAKYRSGSCVETVHGADAVYQRWIHLQCAAREEVCVLDCPPYLTEGNPVQHERNALGIGYRVVYDTTALTVPGRLADIERYIRHGEQARVGTGVPVKLLLADDHAGMLSLDTDQVLVVHASPLLTALRALFESVWHRASPYCGRQRGLSGDDSRLLTLLSAGLTDESIARQLGWHSRTVQRRLRRLMDELGVRTRFQAGMYAQRRGWL